MLSDRLLPLCYDSRTVYRSALHSHSRETIPSVQRRFCLGKSIRLTSGKKCTELDGANPGRPLGLLDSDFSLMAPQKYVGAS